MAFAKSGSKAKKVQDALVLARIAQAVHLLPAKEKLPSDVFLLTESLRTKRGKKIGSALVSGRRTGDRSARSVAQDIKSWIDNSL